MSIPTRDDFSRNGRIQRFAKMYLLDNSVFNGLELLEMYNYEEWQMFILYPNSINRKLASIAKMNAVSIHPFSVFVWQSYSQHSDKERCRYGNQMFHVYFLSVDVPI